MSAKPAILLCGHGSRDEAAVHEFEALARRLAERLPGEDLEWGFLELARPDIAEGLDCLRGRGHRRILAVPCLLFAAGHIKRDIPSVLAAYQSRHADTRIRLGRELGLDARMIAAARARVGEALDRAGGAVPHHETALIVVGRGASTDETNAELAELPACLARDFGFALGETAFTGLGEPLLERALEDVTGRGPRRVVVFPCFLFTGVLVKRIGHLVERAAGRHPEVEFVTALHLGDHPLVLDTIAERVAELRAESVEDREG